MPDFADFLDAKFDLDERSLAPDVRRACFARLAHRDRLRCLDLGSGLGAMIRRVLDAQLPARDIELVALDRDPGLSARARATLVGFLVRRGFVVRDAPAASEDEADRIEASDGRRRVGLRFACRQAERFEPGPGERFDLVTAHAFLDLVPMRPLLERVAGWLATDGLLYATLNYDGGTTLFPPYADTAFETRLLARYDASMEERRVDGMPTGGARSGRRLHAMLPQAGFEIVAYASSDWNAVPHDDGRLRAADAVVVSVLLDALRRENEAHCDRERLADWYRDRRRLQEARRLGAIVHQIDVLAALSPAVGGDDPAGPFAGLTART